MEVTAEPQAVEYIAPDLTPYIDTLSQQQHEIAVALFFFLGAVVGVLLVKCFLKGLNNLD